MRNRFRDSDDLIPSIPLGIEPGSFLVASPALHSTPFAEAVVLVLQSNHDGTFGVVLNRPANDQIKFAYQELTGASPDDPCIVHGGPVGGPVLAIHKDSLYGEIEIGDGIFVSSTSDDLRQLAEKDEGCYRIVFGLSGWKPEQLAREIEDGLWFRLAADAEAVFDDPADMWEKSIRRFGNQLLCDVVGLDQLPDCPFLN